TARLDCNTSAVVEFLNGEAERACYLEAEVTDSTGNKETYVIQQTKILADGINPGTSSVQSLSSPVTQSDGDARYAQQSNNLSDLDSASTARTNLGLGTAATAALLDEDDLSSDSATAVPSQQSVKAYVDAQGATVLDEDDMASDSTTVAPSQQSVVAYTKQLLNTRQVSLANIFNRPKSRVLSRVDGTSVPAGWTQGAAGSYNYLGRGIELVDTAGGVVADLTFDLAPYADRPVIALRGMFWVKGTSSNQSITIEGLDNSDNIAARINLRSSDNSIRHYDNGVDTANTSVPSLDVDTQKLMVTLVIDRANQRYNFSVQYNASGADSVYFPEDRDSSTPSSISLANPVSITTSAAHGLTTGDRVEITGVGGTTEINNRQYTVTVTNTTTITLDGVDGSSYTAFTSEGTIVKLDALPVLSHTVEKLKISTGSPGNTPVVVEDLIVFEPTFAIYGDSIYAGSSGDNNEAYSPYGDKDTDYSITGITAADPAVITIADTSEITDGSLGYITSVSGMTQINSVLTRLTVLSSTTVQCDDIDASAFSAYTSGGTLTISANVESTPAFQLYDLSDGKLWPICYSDPGARGRATTTAKNSGSIARLGVDAIIFGFGNNDINSSGDDAATVAANLETNCIDQTVNNGAVPVRCDVKPATSFGAPEKAVRLAVNAHFADNPNNKNYVNIDLESMGDADGDLLAPLAADNTHLTNMGERVMAGLIADQLSNYRKL
ncbi:MAG: ubiquitin-activating E1 FCCH domain-containing protein, partial [Verrucomicrobiota bacterium]